MPLNLTAWLEERVEGAIQASLHLVVSTPNHQFVSKPTDERFNSYLGGTPIIFNQFVPSDGKIQKLNNIFPNISLEYRTRPGFVDAGDVHGLPLLLTQDELTHLRARFLWLPPEPE